MKVTKITIASFRKTELSLAHRVQDRFTRNTAVHSTLNLYAENGWYNLTIGVIFMKTSTPESQRRYIRRARRIARRIRREVKNG